MNARPTRWYDQNNTSPWEAIKEALRRDWEQTKFDLGLPGGHELNQSIGHTLAQAMQKASIPADDEPNPPRVIGSWEEAEYPIGYGYAAQRDHGREHPVWNEGLEQKLRAEWEANHGQGGRRWADVRRLVRFGYEYAPKK